MKTPREVLLQQHQSAARKLDAIRAGVVAGLAGPPARETVSWRDFARSLRWHFAGLSAAWVVVAVLNTDPSPNPVAMIPRDKIPTPQQLWASLRESRRLLLEYSNDAPVVETAEAPGRRSEMAVEQAVV
jgi:hypothetical protein